MSWYNGTTCYFGDIPGRLDDLDLEHWQPPEDLLAQGSLPLSTEGPDDLLPTMTSLLRASEVPGTSAFAVNGAVEVAESPHISYLEATTAPVYRAEYYSQLDSFSLDHLQPCSDAETAASRKYCALEWCDFLDDIRMPLNPQGCQVPLVAMGDTTYPVHGQSGKPPMSHFSCTLSPLSSCSANTSIQPGPYLAAEWGSRGDDVSYSPLELPQTPAVFLAPVRTGSTGSNDSSVFTYCTMAATTVPAVSLPSGRERPSPNAMTNAPAAPHDACAPKVPASSQPLVCIRAGSSTLYPPQPASATVPAPAAARASRVRASACPAGPAAVNPTSHKASGTRAAATAASPRGARAPAALAAWESITAAQMAPRIITRGAAIVPRKSAPPRLRAVTAPAPPASRPVTRAPAVRLTATERNRKVQREYLHRKQVCPFYHGPGPPVINKITLHDEGDCMCRPSSHGHAWLFLFSRNRHLQRQVWFPKHLYIVMRSPIEVQALYRALIVDGAVYRQKRRRHMRVWATSKSAWQCFRHTWDH